VGEVEEAGEPGSERKYGDIAILRRAQINEDAGMDDHDSEVSGSVQSHGSLRHDSRHDSNSKDIVFFRDVGHAKSNATYNDYTYNG
jgi:hypothetical protein